MFSVKEKVFDVCILDNVANIASNQLLSSSLCKLVNSMDPFTV